MYLRNPCDYDLADGTALTSTNINNNFGQRDAWDVVNTGLLVDRTTDRSAISFPGLTSLHCKLAAVIANYFAWDNNTGNSFVTSPEVWATWDFLMTATPTDGRNRVVALLDQARNQRATVSFSTTRAPQIRNVASGAVTAAASNLALATWYHMELHMLHTGSGTGTADLNVYTSADLKLFTSLTGVALTALTGSTGCGGIYFGIIGTASNTYDGWLCKNLQVSNVENPGVFNPAAGAGASLVAA